MTQMHTEAALAKRQESQRSSKSVEELISKARLDVGPTAEALIRDRLLEMPETARRTYLKAMSGRSRDAGIKAFCMGCLGGQRREIRECTDLACSLYPYRPF